jgi:flagellar basal body P-ring formation protein FlgA
MRTISFLAALLTAIPAAGAVLRPATTLQGPDVRVSDMFDDAGPSGNIVLGRGPAPGGRIVVEAAQAAAIARQFGVDWRPNSSSDQIVIDRPGQLVPREDIVAAIRGALAANGGSADSQIELTGFTAPLVGIGAQPRIAVEQIDADPATGRFAAGLAISTQGEPLQRLRVAGRVQEMVEAVVAARRLAAGTAILAGDVKIERVPVDARQDAATQTDQVVGLAPRHSLNSGQPVALSDLHRATMVRKGDLVEMQLQSPGLSVNATGNAAEPGGLGDRIGVVNPISGAVVEAEIVGPDQVRVLPGAPLRRPPHDGQTQISLR